MSSDTKPKVSAAGKVFISYARGDSAAAHAICAALERSGSKCWMAPRDIPAGVDYGRALIQAAKSASLLLLVFSREADESRNVQSEVATAFKAKIPILPVRLEDVEPDNLEYHLTMVHWYDATSRLEDHLNKIAASASAFLEDQSTGEQGNTSARPAVSDSKAPDVLIGPLDHFIFLSFDSADLKAARRISERLVQLGLKVWLDEQQVPGQALATEDLINRCSLFVPLLSRATRSGSFLLKEWTHALDRSKRLSPDTPFIIPLVLDEFLFLGDNLPPQFQHLAAKRAPGGRLSDEDLIRIRDLARRNALLR